jgi:hypothetical protein
MKGRLRDVSLQARITLQAGTVAELAMIVPAEGGAP